MSQSKLDEFLKDVLSNMKYPFVKDDIELELKSHIEDRVDYYIDKGFPEDKAEELAINHMGDPKEIGIGLSKQHKPSFLKGCLITTGILFSALVIFLIFLNWATRPLPDNKRNISETDARIEIEFNDEEEDRSAIIRTFKEEEYNSFDDKEIRKIMDIVNGNIEGDIPAVSIYEDKDIIFIDFLKDEEPVDPDYLPKIEIEVPEDESGFAPYTTENNRIIFDELEKESGRYFYRIARYRTQYEKYFMHYNIIKIHYEIDGERHISIFGLNSTNAERGTDFFYNEDLENPIKPEI